MRENTVAITQQFTLLQLSFRQNCFIFIVGKHRLRIVAGEPLRIVRDGSAVCLRTGANGISRSEQGSADGCRQFCFTREQSARP